MLENIDLALVWAAIIALGVVIYVVLDGFDLGIGALFLFARDDRERDTMMNSIAPVWDGNATWLILGGAGLFAAFPKAYAVLLSAFYLPLMLMLIALIFRGVAFEFRFKAGESRWLWDWAFAVGSSLAAFCQGLVLGAVVQGLPMANGTYSGGMYGWLTAFSIMTGFAVVVAYALLGACWLIMKTEGALQDRSFSQARRLLLLMLIFIGVVSLWTPFAQPAVYERWFSLPNFYFLSQIPLLTLLLAVYFNHCLKTRAQTAPFFCALGLFVLAYGGLLISLYPYMVPRAITLWEAAAPRATLEFVLVGFLICIPFVLGYTFIGYRLFRGKVQSTYH